MLSTMSKSLDQLTTTGESRRSYSISATILCRKFMTFHGKSRMIMLSKSAFLGHGLINASM